MSAGRRTRGSRLDGAVTAVLVVSNLLTEPRTPVRLPQQGNPRAGLIRTLLGLSGLLLAACLIALCYRIAPSDLSVGRGLLYVGLAVVAGSFVSFVAGRSVGVKEGLALCVALAVVLYLPKLLRSPEVFNFTDELQHYRSTVDLSSGGALFEANPINPLLTHYPGLHVATATLAKVMGSSIFVAGTCLLIFARVLLLVAIFLLYLRLFDRPSRATIATLIYAANPAFLFFDSQFSYESLSLPLGATMIALAFSTDGAEGRRRWLLTGLAVLSGLAAVATHHISTYALVLALALFGVSIMVFEPASRGLAKRLLAIAVVVGAACAIWSTLVAPDTWRYLAHDIGPNLHRAADFLTGQRSARRPFAGSPFPAPTYVRFTSYLAVVLLFAALVGGTLLSWRRRTRRGRLLACSILGALYFASLPLGLLQGSSSAPISARTWEVAFIGLAPVVAVAVDWLVQRRRRLGVVAATLALAVVLTGDAQLRSGDNLAYPGPYLASGGPRAVTPDVIEAARWLRHHYGSHEVVMGDTSIASAFGAYADATPATYQNYGYRPWWVFYARHLTARGRNELQRSGTTFVVVDRRVTSSRPFTGAYFSTAEPRRHAWRTMPRRFLTKFNRSKSFSQVYDNGNVAIYRYLPS